MTDGGIILKQLRGLWPEWKPTDDEVSAFTDALLKFVNQEAVKLGIREYHATKSRWTKPILPDLLVYVKSLVQKTIMAQNKSKGERLSFTLVCIRHDKEPEMIGKEKEFWHGGRDNPTSDDLMRRGQFWKNKLDRCGVEWKIEHNIPF